jgi:hypothetical protein
MPEKDYSSLERSKEILTAEYEYIANTANQANEDRARVASFYLVAVGSLVAALFSTQLLDTQANSQTLSLLFSGLFTVLTLLGTLTVTQLARLRAAWYESMLALNQIKEYTISQEKGIAKAFRWRADTMPPLYKITSISFQQTLEVALLSGMTFGAAIYFYQVGINYNCHPCNLAYSAAGGVFVFLLQLYLYKRLLNPKQKDK